MRYCIQNKDLYRFLLKAVSYTIKKNVDDVMFVTLVAPPSNVLYEKMQKIKTKSTYVSC